MAACTVFAFGHPSRRMRPEGWRLARSSPLAILRDACAQSGRMLLIRNSSSERLNVHGISQVFEAPDEALCLCGLGAAVEMVTTEVLIGGSVLEHVIGGGKNGGGNGADGLLRSARSEERR